VVRSSPKASGTYRRGTRAAVNTAEMPTGDVVRFRDADLASPARLRAIRQVIGNDNLDTINANALAERLLGDAVYANIIMLGFAWQRGLIPVALPALLRAIELNGVAVERNKQALAWGRIAVADPEFLPGGDEAPEAETLDQIIDRRADFLAAYQDAAYAMRYRATVARVRRAEAALSSEVLTEAVARALFKLMAYKDEYEVARLHMQSGFLGELKREFEDGFRVQYHLAPPFLPSKPDARGRPRKRAFGQWIQMPLAMLARLKGLRGTPFDPFGYTNERRTERELIAWYEGLIERMLGQLNAAHLPDLVTVAKAPMEIRGYGPVKDTAIAKVKPEVERLLTNLTTSVTQKMHAHG
jgi:indolepyruvate ferredoxin oxidoreductase